MNVQITSEYNQVFPISGLMPKELYGQQIPGLSLTYGEVGEGYFIFQHIAVKNFSLAYLTFKLSKRNSFILSASEPFSAIMFSLTGDVSFNHKNETTLIKESRFNILNIPGKNINLVFDKAGDYVMLVLLFLKEEMLQQLNYYPVFTSFKACIHQNKTCSALSGEVFTSIRMFDCIHQLLHSPYVQSTERFHENIIKRLQRLSLNAGASLSHENLKFSLEFLESLYEAKQYIDSRLLMHDTIAQLSRKVGVNELKLKKGFKEAFGIGLYGYRKRERLRIAKAELDQTNKSVKQIAKNAGYKNASNFSIAFKKVFGISPQSARKKT